MLPKITNLLRQNASTSIIIRYFFDIVHIFPKRCLSGCIKVNQVTRICGRVVGVGACPAVGGDLDEILFSAGQFVVECARLAFLN